MFNRIVIANDGSEGAARALSAAIKLAKQHDAELHMVSVEELPQFAASVDEVIEEKTEANHFFEAIITRAERQAQAMGVKLVPMSLLGMRWRPSWSLWNGNAPTCS
jgi:nucleotide-binding universal stress UspA family protein